MHPSPYHLTRVCAECNTVIGTKPTADPSAHRTVTHGLCESCEQAVRERYGLGPRIEEEEKEEYPCSVQ